MVPTGSLLQLLMLAEHLPCKKDYAGSIPVCSSLVNRPRGTVKVAPQHPAGLAQWYEHCLGKTEVPCSIHGFGSLAPRYRP